MSCDSWNSSKNHFSPTKILLHLKHGIWLNLYINSLFHIFKAHCRTWKSSYHELKQEHQTTKGLKSYRYKTTKSHNDTCLNPCLTLQHAKCKHFAIQQYFYSILSYQITSLLSGHLKLLKWATHKTHPVKLFKFLVMFLNKPQRKIWRRNLEASNHWCTWENH